MSWKLLQHVANWVVHVDLSINMSVINIHTYDNKLLPIIDKWEACAKSLKQLEVALEVELSTDEEELLTKEQKGESSKHGLSM